MEREADLRSREGRRSFWHFHVWQVAREGISIRRYCCEHGLSEASFYYWRQKFLRVAKEKALVPASRFTRIRVSGESFSSPVRMALGQGVVLFFEREPSPVWIQELAVVLGERS